MKNEELKFEWDENKNRINIQKHGVSFEEATILFKTSDLILEAKNVDEEKRFALIGKYNSKCGTDRIRNRSCFLLKKRLFNESRYR